MGTPIKKTTAGTTATPKQPPKPAKTGKTQGGQKPQGSQQTPKKEKVDPKLQSVFDQIEKNTQQDLKDQEKFMQDMFGDVL